MNDKKNIKSTNWLTKGMSKEQLEREKREAIMSVDLQECFTEFNSNGDIYTDFDVTAEKMVAKGYRKQSEGEWITETVNWVYDVKKKYCSACGTNARYDTHMHEYILTNFCPTCGAKMKGGAE